MKLVLPLLIALVLALNLSACGTKGKLKTPSQVEHDQQKKAKKEADKKKKEEEEKEDQKGEQKTETTPPNPLPQGEGAQ